MNKVCYHSKNIYESVYVSLVNLSCVSNVTACVRSLVEMEEAYLKELKQLEEMQTHLSDSSLGIAANDLKAIFRNLDEITRHQTKLVQSMQTASTEKNACIAVCRVLSASFGDRSSLYIPYVQRKSYCAEALSHCNKSSKVQKEITVFCARSALSGKSALASFEDALEEPYKHLFQLKSCLEHARDGVPPETEQWKQLNLTIDRCAGVIGQLDEANLQSEQVKALFFLRPMFHEDCKDIVTYCREFLYDGVLTVVSFTPRTEGEGSGNMSGIGQYQEHRHYQVFLFSDILLFCEGKKKSSSKHPLKVIGREPVNMVSVSHNVCLQKSHRFTLKCRSGEMDLEAKNSDIMQEWIRSISRAVSNRQRTMVIGAPLGDVLTRTSERNYVVPSVIEHALQCIEKYGLEEEGIFRVARSKLELDELQNLVDSGRQPWFVDPILASLLVKRWLIALPEPLLFFKQKDREWFAARRNPEELRTCVETLGKMRNSVLFRIVDVLKKVAANSSVNKMNVNSLSVIFGMIFFPTKDPGYSNLSIETFQALLEHSDDIFKEIRANEITRQSSLKTMHKLQRMGRVTHNLGSEFGRTTPSTTSAPSSGKTSPATNSGFMSHPIPRNL